MKMAVHSRATSGSAFRGRRFSGLSGRPGKPAAAEEAYHMDQKVPLTRKATNTATSHFLTLCCMAATPAAGGSAGDERHAR